MLHSGHGIHWQSALGSVGYWRRLSTGLLLPFSVSSMLSYGVPSSFYIFSRGVLAPLASADVGRYGRELCADRELEGPFSAA
jgi:hypothetical protein